MQKASDNPIGIFDSGIGGLTVAYAVTKLLPNESFIYFGDTAHAPWGDKSAAAIQAYSIKICDVLLQHNCKLILIACNSASAAAYDLVKEYVGSKAQVINVIDPVVNYLREKHSKKIVGLIGTKQTVNSNIYKKKVEALQIGIELNALATPLLVPLIEEGFANNQITADVLKIYLSNPILQDIDALVLGCTHYPLIKNYISQFYQNKIMIIDSSEIVATAVSGLLEYHGLLNTSNNVFRSFFISDYTEAFVNSSKLFFQDEIELKQFPLWE